MSAQHSAADLKSYDVVVNGIETTLRLTEADAEARGLTAPATKAKAKAAPANKQAAPEGDKRAAAVAKSFGQGKPKAAKGDA